MEAAGLGKRNLKGEVKENVLGYFSQTTVHGFRYVVQGRNIFERVIWILFILFGFMYSSKTVWDAWVYWDTHPVETTIDQVSVPVQELPFPAITICDTQSLQMPRRNRWMFLETLLNSVEVINPQQLIDGMTPGKNTLYVLCIEFHYFYKHNL